MKSLPFGRIIGDRTPIAVEADDVAPARAGLDRLRGLPCETAAEIEVIGIVTMQGFRDGAVIGLGKPPRKYGQIVDNGGVVEGRAGQREADGVEVAPGPHRDAPGAPRAVPD